MAGKCIRRSHSHAAGTDRPGYVWYFAASNKLKNYGGYFNYKDHSVLKMICQAFGVSKSAAIIRLKELDYMEEYAYSDFRDPLEVWNEE